MMKKEVRVFIVEDDPFAENWMALLLARDWRTRVVGEVGSLGEFAAALRSGRVSERPTLALVDADVLENTAQVTAACGPAGDLPVLLIGRKVNQAVAENLPFPGFCGYLLKNEIRCALGWAVAMASPGSWVITPGLEQTLSRLELHPERRPAHALLLDGRKSFHRLTEHEAEVARMALIFSMERRELSDEIKISEDWSYGLVSGIYHKLGMDEILSGEVNAAEYLGKPFVENPRFQEVLRQALKSRKKNDLETLAFHILCMPEIRELF